MTQREETPYFRECQKLGGIQQKDIYLSPTKAATYLYLLNHVRIMKVLPCNSAKRRVCKWDTTIEQDGPATCRILVPVQKREKCINGWQNVGYEVFYQNKDTIADQKQLNLDYENDEIQQQLENNERMLTNDFKYQMKNLAKFYKELNQKYRLNVQDPDFKERVQIAKEQLQRQRNKPLQYFKKDGVKFVELLQELIQADKRQPTLLERFKAFNQLKASQFRIKEKLPEKLYNKTTNDEDPTPRSRNKLLKKSCKFIGQTSRNVTDTLKMKFQLKDKSYHMSKQFDNYTPNLLKVQSQSSISFHKKNKTDNEEYLDRQLEKFASRMIQPQFNVQEINTENINKLIESKSNLKQLCLKKIQSKTLIAQSEHRSKTERQESDCNVFTSRSRDKDSTKASIIFKRSQLLTSFTNKSDCIK
ncbi:unnamed protein product (macronuclear) [Paramecium tetraurelia]|uniref:Uncharacterized protein n=1 Tax=Paramecium tetraurelia TaxID=5888 RepID=A0BVM7_PARTE|nr:uncharacterized protein GSPATT00032446001 [Paramecium tetraurelia]CAK62594.1 unnamed protein product [Paramecium tetraurelia]|eukprot:XP_001429992.1 hypothetical protein (macronuclear) [Paramecium tetraurelia strain d4-2]